MKGLISKLTGGGGFKNLLVQHGEKMGFGLVALGVLGVLFFGTDWARTDKSPDVITRDVEAANLQIQNSTWSDEKKAAFGLVDYSDKAQALLSPIPLEPYEFTTNMYWPLYRKQELAKEPDYLAVEALDAKFGLAILSVADKTAMPGMLADGSMPEDMAADGSGSPLDAAPKPTGEFAIRTPGGAGGAGGAGFPGSGLGGGAAVPGFPPGAGLPEMAGAPGLPEDMMGVGGAPGMEGYGMGGMMSNVKPRGVRFVAVRGVWPVSQQLSKLQRALNLQTMEEARQFLQVIDFKLERQRAVAGDKPWSGPWEPVNVETAMEVLKETSDYDFDPVHPQVTDTSITMPLPLRLLGYWDEYATHPAIENFKLSPAEMEQQRRLEEKLAEEYAKHEKMIRRQMGPEKKGFAGLQQDFRQMGNDLFSSEYAADAMGSMSRSMMDYQQEMGAAGMPPMPGMGNMKNPQAMKAQLTVIGRLLLFRYMDFAVEPGMAYRYRVKLDLRNPNYGRPIETVVDRSVIEGETRETPWSLASNPAVVQESVNYFLDKIDRDPHAIDQGGRRTIAELEIFEWDPDMGTMKTDIVKINTLGQFIAEKKKSLLLNVAKPSFKDEEVTFSTDDMLLDAVGDAQLNLANHPDLKLSNETRGKLGLLNEALVLKETGELALLDPLKGAQSRKQLAERVAGERKNFEHLKNKEEMDPSMLEGGMMIPGMEGSMPMEMMMGDPMMMEQMMRNNKKGKKKNPRKPPMGMMGMP